MSRLIGKTRATQQSKLPDAAVISAPITGAQRMHKHICQLYNLILSRDWFGAARERARVAAVARGSVHLPLQPIYLLFDSRDAAATLVLSRSVRAFVPLMSQPSTEDAALRQRLQMRTRTTRIFVSTLLLQCTSSSRDRKPISVSAFRCRPKNLISKRILPFRSRRDD